MSGVSIGSTPFSTSASPTAFETRCSATSCMICGLKRWRITVAGTLPGRKPGMRAERAELRGGLADGFVDDVAGHLDREIAARFVHVNNF